jgi:nitrogen regulatory protein PII
VHFKLIVVISEDSDTDAIVRASRKAGATGATVLNQARGEGLTPARTFFGLELESQRDVILLLVEEHLSRHILETVGEVGRFDRKPGAGIAFQIDVEDAVGVIAQMHMLEDRVEGEL